MTKLYEEMGVNENMSWCKPFVSEDGSTAIIINEGRVICELNTNTGIDWMNMTWDEIEEKMEELELEEVGCASCPFRDECDAMIPE